MTEQVLLVATLVGCVRTLVAFKRDRITGRVRASKLLVLLLLIPVAHEQADHGWVRESDRDIAGCQLVTNETAERKRHHWCADCALVSESEGTECPEPIEYGDLAQLVLA